jgi:hypothetical protein
VTAITEALAAYNATVAPSGFIARDGRELSVRPVVKGRLRMESRTGALLFSGPATGAAVHAFVKGYWFWTVPS